MPSPELGVGSTTLNRPIPMLKELMDRGDGEKGRMAGGMADVQEARVLKEQTLRSTCHCLSMREGEAGVWEG